MLSVQAEREAPAPRTQVAELNPGSRVQAVYLVSTKELQTTRAGRPYLKLRLGDSSGVIDCLVWEDAEAVAARLACGDLVTIQGRVTQYRGRPRLEADSLVPLRSDQLQAQEFLPRTYRDLEELKDFLRFQIESVYDRDYRALLDLLFGYPEFLERFATAPAAKSFHHAYLGGLLEHTVSVADLCDHVSQQYARVDRDLLMTAALLHDVGKVQELTYETAIDYSDAGRFLGHVILGVTLVSDQVRRLPDFPPDKLQLLLHAIASHHGELEWGSPKRPKTIEAMIIHHVDNLDAKVKGFLEIVEGSRNAPWTDLRNLFRRPLHVPRANHQEDDYLPACEDDGVDEGR